MNSTSDTSLLLWLFIFIASLAIAFAPFLASGRFHKKLMKALGVFSKPIEVTGSLGCARYNIADVTVAAQIIQSWFPHDETDYFPNAPAPLCGRLTRSINFNQGTGAITFEVFYDIFFPGSSFTVSRRSARFTCHLREDRALKELDIEYEWNGAEFALTDLFSIDYKVARFLMEKTHSEFLCRGYKVLKQLADSNEAPLPAARTMAGRQVKQWWRGYSAGEQGEKVYKFWPSPQDYSEAVQAPTVTFKDPDLKTCLPVLNVMGIPRVTSGMFASVYQLQSNCQQWAVRCFDTRLIDQQERYKAISGFILSDDLTYTVDFHYLEDGIKCGDTWFPILKMTWVEGVPLDAFVRDNLKNPTVLQNLRWEFQTMMEKLHSNGVAHCDLQHGNVMVSNGEIFLVDYDAFYVPELAGKHSNELGHANYQHPGRTEKHFGPDLDNFSALVIDLSLLCLIEDPSLWETFNGGDECLLFRKNDFVNPGASRLIAALKDHPSEAICRGVQRLLTFLTMPVEDLPYLKSDRPQEISLIEELLQSRLN